MSKQPPSLFATRKTVTLELPLAPNARLLRPDQVMVKLEGRIHDVGALCYGMRSDVPRKPGRPRDVIIGSLRKERINQVRQLIKVASIFIEDGGMRSRTVDSHLGALKSFVDWADANGLSNCLAGGEATRSAYLQYASDIEDRHRRHEFESEHAYRQQTMLLTVLEALTGQTELAKGIRLVRNTGWRNGGTEPAPEDDFARALAVNEALFEGICDLVLESRPFPFKLPMPKSLGWVDDFLWVFPTSRWCMPPHQCDDARSAMRIAYWRYDYRQGKLAEVDDIWHRYRGPDFQRQANARVGIARARAGLEAANADSGHYYRRMLAMVAHSAFCFLFLANTAANASPLTDIETDGVLAETTANPGYRATKWRAGGKEVNLIIPVAFVPTLRRFLELRRYLLNEKSFPYLFMTFGIGRRDLPKKMLPNVLRSHHTFLRRIDPKFPGMKAKKIRATVSDYYSRKHDATIEAAVLQHKATTAEQSYSAGTESGHHVELTLLMEKIAQKAEQLVVAKHTIIDSARPLEDGGVCPSYGNPAPFGLDAPVKPDCKTGCLFCSKRVLIASEEDTRKVASAAYLMEQLIMGPASEAEFRPRITKCDADLEMIRAFEGCSEMVDRVKRDVYEYGNLTPYFADKYQLFLTLGVL